MPLCGVGKNILRTDSVRKGSEYTFIIICAERYDSIVTALKTIENLNLDFVKNQVIREKEKRQKKQKMRRKIQIST